MYTTLKYDFCQVQIHDSYMVVVMNEGIHITSKYTTVLVDLALTYYKDKPFVYITHRIHSYSVDPSVYLKTSKLKNLSGFAVVAAVPVAKANAEIEKLFLDKPFEIFYSLSDAIAWAKTIIPDE